jgi:hypothetical protein
MRYKHIERHQVAFWFRSFSPSCKDQRSTGIAVGILRERLYGYWREITTHGGFRDGIGSDDIVVLSHKRSQEHLRYTTGLHGGSFIADP